MEYTHPSPPRKGLTNCCGLSQLQPTILALGVRLQAKGREPAAVACWLTGRADLHLSFCERSLARARNRLRPATTSLREGNPELGPLFQFAISDLPIIAELDCCRRCPA